MTLRALVIDDEPVFRRLLSQHIATGFDAVSVVEFDPAAQGRLPPEFHASGYDVVLLDETPGAGTGLEWLRDLCRRPGFPPVLYLLSRLTEEAEQRARAAGAYACLGKRKIGHERLVELLREAQALRQPAGTGTRAPDEPDPQSRFGGHVIRGYRCLRRIAENPVSGVYLAESSKLGAEVVLKVLHQTPDPGRGDATFDRFMREYEIAAGLRHPNLVRIFDFGAGDDYTFIAMEYFEHGDLRARMKAGIAPAEAARLLGQMAAALQALHEAGVLHRDLKPGNVMLREDGSVVLIDFGMSKQLALGGSITSQGEIFGTPFYMSPEQGHGRETDGRSDLYSLGVILYEMLTRRKPYTAATPMQVIYKHAHEPLPALPPALKRFEALLHRCMAKDPAGRFGSAAELAAAVAELEAVGTGPLSAAATPRQLLLSATPEAWLREAARDWRTLLVDHANCEKKAASSALAMMFAYAEDTTLARRLSRLAREELRHFERVLQHMESLRVPFTRLSPARYAEGLRKAMSTTEPDRRLDLLLAGALIEARSCERFAGLWPRLEEPLAGFYRGLEDSEARHFRVYLDLARDWAGQRGLDLEARLAALAEVESQLATAADTELRFHSGPPG